jgi:hypothetical protein
MHKRRLEKDVERAFGILQAQFAIVRGRLEPRVPLVYHDYLCYHA